VVTQPGKRGPRVGIVGTGLAGSILAELLGPACDLVVFERGNEHHERATDIQFTAHQPGWQSFCYGLGGTTNLWTGGLVELLPEEFSPAWPASITRELPEYYPAVVNQLYHEDARDAWLQRTLQPLHEDACLTSIYYPFAAFCSTESRVLRECNVQPNCNLRKIDESSQGVELVFSQNGSTRKELVDYAILACGGLNSPIPLMRSGMGGSAVGRNYTDHPTGYVAKISGAKNRELFDLLCAATHGFQKTKAFVKLRDPQSGLWSACYLRPTGSLKFKSDPYINWSWRLTEPSAMRRYLRTISGLTDFDEIYRIAEYRFGMKLPRRYAYVHVYNEQEDTGQGDYTLSSNGDAALSWQVSDVTIGSIQRNLATFASLLGADLHLPTQPMIQRIHSGAHHSGMCRIAANAADGVVDENLLVHGNNRTFVCDGSVLPSTGASNTALTIGSLAHRLSKHLKSIFAGN